MTTDLTTWLEISILYNLTTSIFMFESNLRANVDFFIFILYEAVTQRIPLLTDADACFL